MIRMTRRAKAVVRWLKKLSVPAAALFAVADAFFGAMDAVGTMGFDDPLSGGAGLLTLAAYFILSIVLR